MTLQRALVAAGSVAALAVVLAAGAVTGARASSGSGAAAADGSASFTDPAGDVAPSSAPGMPAIAPVDITAVTVADVTASGMITFSVTATGFGTRGANQIGVWLDTDRNASTGRPPTGDEYRLGVACCAVSGSLVWDASAWNGAALQPIQQPVSAIGFSRNGDVFTWTISKADLAGTSGFAFHVTSAGLDYHGKVIGPDQAPDSGTWAYDLSKPPPPPTTTAPVVKPLIGAPTITPARAVAGKRLTVVFSVTRSDTGAPLTNGTMICDPSVAGRVVPHSEQFRNGTAKLAFVVPKTAKGKLLKVKLTIKAGRGSAAKVATFLVH